MRCPVCRTPLVIVEHDGVELDLCVREHGTWFDAQELSLLFARAGAPEELLRLEERLDRLPHEGKARRCPRCDRRMHHVTAPGAQDRVVLDACPRHHGLWFDPGELRRIVEDRAEAGAEELRPVLAYLGDFAGPATGSARHEGGPA